MAISNPGGNLNSGPSATKQTLSENYLDLASSSNAGWSQQYVPDLMEKEAEVFGPRTISGFLAQVGAEEAMTADQVVWSEQGRLHLNYTGDTHSGDETITIANDVDGNAIGADHGIRVNDMLLITTATVTARGVCTGVNSAVIHVELYDGTDITTTLGSSTAVQVLVYGSEYGKGQSYKTGTDGVVGSLTNSDSRTSNEPFFKSFSNKPIIMKDFYSINGSDTSQIGWVEISQETGPNGY